MPERIVETRAGKVGGQRRPGLRRWLGIPFAAAGRFEAPGPVSPWQGVRPGDRHGKQSPQQFGRKISREVLDSEDYGEDCLHLNVWTPDGGAPGPKPVMVWIHGGAYMSGSANPYDGAALACEGDITVVTINYRLGVLGFVNFGDVLGLPAIPSNLGLRDQIAALEWVHENIEAFGGDPDRVTICGESAGSMSVSLLMLAKRARGLFHGAIMQSGAVSLIHDRERSIADARRYAQLLGLDQGGLEQLKAMDIVGLFETQVAVGNELTNSIPAAPWFDGDLLPASIEEAHAHEVAPVPLLAGTTRDENRLFELMPGDILPTKRPDLEVLLRAQFAPDHATRILACYPNSRKGQTALGSDLVFKMPTRNFAERHSSVAPTWFYRFDYSHPLAGAVHGLDLTVFWPFTGLKMALARGGPNSGRRKALAERMRAHAAQFVRNGNPGDDWPAYEQEQRMVRLYALNDSIAANPDAERFATWAGRDIDPGKDARPALTG
jgi:para-nitrobenzyl esterase